MECGEAKREEVARYWRKLRDEEIGDLYCLTNTVRVVMSRCEMDEACSKYRRKEKCMKVVSGEVEGNRKVGSTKYRWVHEIEINFCSVHRAL